MQLSGYPGLGRNIVVGLRTGSVASSPLLPDILLMGDSSKSLQLGLASAGAPNCTLFVNPILTFVQMPRRWSGNMGSSKASSSTMLPIPRVQALVGAQLDFQCVLLDSTANAMGLAFSDSVRIRVGL